MSENRDIPCPACGFLTLEDAYGSYVLCDVCGWEDDQVQLANPACRGGANSESLIDAQVALLARYPVAVNLAQGFRRDPRWRPLDEAERCVAERERDEKYWGNGGIVSVDECYWMKRPSSRRQAGDSLVAEVAFLSETEGGRQATPICDPSDYRPHAVVDRDDEY